jgi:serine/threonine-protein kinase
MSTGPRHHPPTDRPADSGTSSQTADREQREHSSPGTLAGRYRLAEVIGRGGMATVYRASDPILDRAVAVKLLSAQLADRDPVSVARFENEARAAAALNHPSLVAVYDTGTEAGAPFIVMELVAGRSLDAILRDRGPLGPDHAARIAAQVADALAAAHAAAIIHRDIKPANVMITNGGDVKVLDFGIARAVDGITLTQDAAIVGTAAYMAPERATGQPADARSDVYSLGCVLYALLTGHPPFTADHAAAMLHQHANAAPDPPNAANGQISPALNSIVMRMLAKAPADRPRSAAQVRDELAAVAPVAPSRAALAPEARTSTPLVESAGSTAPTRALRRAAQSPRRWGALAALAGALAIGVLAVIAFAAGGSPDRAPHSTAANRVASSAPRAHHSATAAAKTSPATTTHPPVAATTAQPPPPVAQAASALSNLTTQDLQSGAIDAPAANVIAHSVADVLNAYAAGDSLTAQHKLADLVRQITAAETQGDITASAVPQLSQAVAALGAALADNPPAPSGPPAGPPPGHGHGRGHGHQPDGQGNQGDD